MMLYLTYNVDVKPKKTADTVTACSVFAALKQETCARVRTNTANGIYFTRTLQIPNTLSREEVCTSCIVHHYIHCIRTSIDH